MKICPVTGQECLSPLKCFVWNTPHYCSNLPSVTLDNKTIPIQSESEDELVRELVMGVKGKGTVGNAIEWVKQQFIITRRSTK